MADVYQTNKRPGWSLFLMVMMLGLASIYQQANAQVSNLAFWSSKTVPYSSLAITGGTVVSSTTSDDDNNYTTQNIGFTFNYCGSSYTSVGISANGYIRLGSATSTYYSNVCASQSLTISAGNNDLQGAGLSTSEIRIQTIGTSPNRICVIQFRDWSHYNYVNYTGDIYNFQFRLYEGTNTKVQIVYGPNVSNSPTGYTFTSSAPSTINVGVTGNTTADFSVLTGSDWVNPTVATTASANMNLYNTNVPDSGRTYNWVLMDQVVDSVSTVQRQGNVSLGGTNQAVVAAVWYNRGALNPKVAQSITFNTTGTTNTSDLVAARVFYTGNSATYSSSSSLRQFGSSITSPSGSMYFSDTLSMKTGANYFWLVYDITSSTSALGHSVDATCSNVVDSSGPGRTPIVQAPAGSNLITGPMLGNYTIDPSGSGSTNFTSFDPLPDGSMV